MIPLRGEGTLVCKIEQRRPHQYSNSLGLHPISSTGLITGSYAAVPRISTVGRQGAIFPQPRLLKQPGLFLSVSFRSKTTATPEVWTRKGLQRFMILFFLD